LGYVGLSRTPFSACRLRKYPPMYARCTTCMSKQSLARGGIWSCHPTVWLRELAGRVVSGRVYCTAKAMWKLGWFLRDFLYDPDLLGREEVDEKVLSGLRGVVKISRRTVNGTCLLNFDGFAPAGCSAFSIVHFTAEVEKELTGREMEPHEIIYFNLYKSQIPIVEQSQETAARMLATDKSRGYCLEMICADFLVGTNLKNGNSKILLQSIMRFFNFLPREERQTFLEHVGEIA
jgi:hypothetical protein